MRDSHILAGLGQVEAKVGHDVQLLAQEIRIIRFRQQAYEEVMFGGGPFRIMRLVFLLAWSPELVQKMLDDETQKCADQFYDAMAKVQEDRTKMAKGIVLPKGVGVIGA